MIPRPNELPQPHEIASRKPGSTSARTISEHGQAETSPNRPTQC